MKTFELYRRQLLLLGVLLSFLSGSFVAFAQSEEDLFEKAFGKKALSPQRISVPLIIQNRHYSDIEIVLDPKSANLQLESSPLIAHLQPHLRLETQSLLRSSANSQGQISLSALKDIGLDAVYDESVLELRITVPPSLRPPSEIRIFGSNPPPESDRALAPGDLSGFLNFRTGFDHVQQSATGLDEGLQPFRGDLEAALNWNNWVLEGTGSYVDQSTHPWHRGDFRLVHDDPAKMLRYSIGDLSYPTTGFQSFRPMGGISVSKNFSLQPYRVTEPRGQTSFFLRSPSRVEVFVNGRPVQTLQLPAGPHNMRDFVFSSGGNDVLLRITDDVGRVETISLSFFFDSRLLVKGEHEFTYNFGYPSQLNGGGRNYDTDSPVVSLFHRAGLTDSLTAGLNFQGNTRQQMLGADSVWATPLGIFNPDLAVSWSDDFNFGYATRLGYHYFDATSAWGSAWAFAAQYRSPDFTALTDFRFSNTIAWDFTARYSQRLPWEMNGGIGGSYQIGRAGRRDSTGISLFFNKRFGRNWFADITLDRRDTFRGETEHRAYLSLTYLFPSRRHSIRASHDTFSDTTRSDYQFSSRDYIGGFDGNIGLQRRSADYSALGSLRHNGYRAESSLSHDVTSPARSGEQVDSRTSFRFGTALVYSDGLFALSRPVRDSFAIIAPHPAYKDVEIGVDPLRDSFSARIDRFGPAVVPDLTSYHVRNLAVQSGELPEGFDLGPSVYAIRPTYKSGTVIRVGSDPSILLSGTLENSDGTAVPLEAGELIRLDTPDSAPIDFFTNRRGGFSIEGIKPGRYELRLFNDAFAHVTLEIPQNTVGGYDIEELKVPSSSSLPSSSNNSD